MKNFNYILDENGTPHKVSLREWSQWCLDHPDECRVVRQEYIGNYWISTVFLGFNHNYDPSGSPILWETMVFPKYANHGDGKHWTSRYRTRCAGNKEQAEAMHEAMVKRICEVKHIKYETERKHENRK